MTSPSSPRAGRSTVSAAGEPPPEYFIDLFSDHTRDDLIAVLYFSTQAAVAAESRAEAAESRPSVTERPAESIDRLRASANVARYANLLAEAQFEDIYAVLDWADRAASPAGPPPMSENEAATFSDLEGPESEPPNLRLLEVAMTARRMVEDGHPDSKEWFRIMRERLQTVSDLTDAALMEGVESVAGVVPQSEREGLPNRDLLAEAIFESGVRQTMSQSEMAADNILAEMSILLARLASPAHPDEEPR